MEPMALGSPGNVSPAFAPGFLMGDLASPASKNPSESTSTPSSSQTPRRVSFAPDAFSHHSTVYAGTPVNPLRARLTGTPQQGAASPQKRGPPIMSLSDVTNTSFQNQSLLSQQNVSFASNQSFAFNQSQMTAPSFGHSLTPMRTAEASAFTSPNYDWHANDENKEAEHWVTVFGFPFTMVPAVLTWIASCGNIIVRHVPTSPKANWMHLRFANPAETRRALGRHGSLLGLDTMIAVVPCMDKGVIQGWRSKVATSPGANNSFSEAGGTYIFSSTSANTSCLNSSTYGSPMNSSIRSLVASPDISVETSVLPRKSTGMVSKAMDYVFGW
ncbi:nucleoporin NUP35 [Neocloeon triangulifer]|uniref:nucleoporin NUP35 n=1 Tax=Neocloeon triangulifer TaxID=2078957 RepID=UPI00286EBCBF|nr:nucleoporin NUP35 [Neocloeon triangulifer]